jgi:hypothetical protein
MLVHAGHTREGNAKGEQPKIRGEYRLVEESGKRGGEEPKQHRYSPTHGQM